MQKATITSIQKFDRFTEIIQRAFSVTDDADLAEWYSFEEAQRSLDSKKATAFKATLNKDLVIGVVHAQPESFIFGREGRNKLQITNIGVLPQYQRRGVGGKLLGAVEKVARQKQIPKVIVHTNPDDRRAVGFYLKYGYKPVGIIEDYYYRGPAQFFLKFL